MLADERLRDLKPTTGTLNGTERIVAPENPEQPAPLSLEAGGHPPRVAPGARRAALRAARGDSRDCRFARPEPGGSARHHDVLPVLPRGERTVGQDASVGVPQPGLRPARQR